MKCPEPPGGYAQPQRIQRQYPAQRGGLDILPALKGEASHFKMVRIQPSGKDIFNWAAAMVAGEKLPPDWPTQINTPELKSKNGRFSVFESAQPSKHGTLEILTHGLSDSGKI